MGVIIVIEYFRGILWAHYYQLHDNEFSALKQPEVRDPNKTALGRKRECASSVRCLQICGNCENLSCQDQNLWFNEPSEACCIFTMKWSCVNILAQNKLEGTLWMDMDDAKVFKILDLEDIEKTFSAYQRQQVQMLTLLILGLMSHGISQQCDFNVPFLFIILIIFANCIWYMHEWTALTVGLFCSMATVCTINLHTCCFSLTFMS